jgi:hypothetical protein
MSVRNWEKKVLAADGAKERVASIEDELRLAAGLTYPSPEWRPSSNRATSPSTSSTNTCTRSGGPSN